MMKTRVFYTVTIVVMLACFSRQSLADTVASEDFDGGAVNLISGFDPSMDNLDGGGGDFFGVGDLATWPQGFPPGIPFSLTDDSVIDVAGGTRDPANSFPGDTEGDFGQNRDVDDAFFAISDTRDFDDEGPPSASWTFDISGFTELELSVDLAGQANDSFDGFNPATLITFEARIDGGATQTALSIAPNPVVGDFVYRAMDDGVVPPIGANGPLQATGDNAVTKTLAETGAMAADLFLNKTPADGAGAGLMDTFTTAINGTGSQLVLTMTADLQFEAMAFDNIQITGVPEPGSFSLLVLAGVLLVATRRRG